MIKNFRNLKRGMTYVELIVVLSIFSIMSSIVIFNHGEFQARIDLKNLANDVALKIVEAQKSSIFGKFPSAIQQIGLPLTWKPSYGIFINRSLDDKSFVYFVDLNGNHFYDGSDCIGECMEKISITKGNSISKIEVFYLNDINAYPVTDITLSFTRPDTTAVIKSSIMLNPNVSHVQLTLVSPKSAQTTIKLYASGRVQIN